MLSLSMTDANMVAMDFLMQDLEIPDIDQDFFSILANRETGSEWYVVEIGVEGLPDKWVLQVFDTGQCDPCYTFVSPMPKEEDADLEEFPERIAQVITMERAGHSV
ncbi:hypothetical protein Lepto7375DRAFT_2136 [Leptolyngbya sp. PCC 7375]|nr:hypothetical protein Lepto7375DRAFT_2136 [Leptolyngbya sp. PCC 7375]